MRIFSIFILCIWSFSLTSCLFKPANKPKRSATNKNKIGEADKCYVKCLIPSIYKKKIVEYSIFLGDPDTSKHIKFIQVITKHKRSNWFKQQSEGPCNSLNPEDCMIWCLKETPEESQTLTTVKDTLKEKNFVNKTYVSETLIKQGGQREWVETICKEKMEQGFYMDLGIKLKNLGYFKGPVSDNYNYGLKNALINFQKENGLPYGVINIPTLKKLGIF